MALRMKYPQCRMMGVDGIEQPSRSAVEIDPNSVFLHANISTKSVGQMTKKKSYTVPDLLMWHNEGRVVDFLSADINEMAYELLDVLNSELCVGLVNGCVL